MQGALGGWSGGSSDAWMELSSISDAVADGGSWMGFGAHNTSETSEYDGFGRQDYMNMMNGLDSNAMGGSFMSSWATEAKYNDLYKAINGPFAAGAAGAGGAGGAGGAAPTMATFTFESIEWPVEPSCIIDVTTKAINEWFLANGKGGDAMTTIGNVLATQTLPLIVRTLTGNCRLCSTGWTNFNHSRLH